jgi:predicted kinase
LLVVVGGLMGTGKTTLATALAEVLESESLSTDAIRREMFGASPGESKFGGGYYSPERRQQVYGTLFARAEEVIGSGLSVVLDGTFLRESLRDRATDLARRTGAKLLIVYCRCPDDVARARIASRQADGGSLSEARPQLRSLQREEEEPPGRSRAEIVGSLLEVDTMQGVAAQVAQVVDWFRDAAAQATCGNAEGTEYVTTYIESQRGARE